MELDPHPTNKSDVNPLFEGINSGIDPRRLEGNSAYPRSRYDFNFLYDLKL